MAAAPITVTRSRCPRTLTRSTQKPVSGLWKVTRSTRPARASRSATAAVLIRAGCRSSVRFASRPCPLPFASPGVLPEAMMPTAEWSWPCTAPMRHSSVGSSAEATGVGMRQEDQSMHAVDNTDRIAGPAHRCRARGGTRSSTQAPSAPAGGTDHHQGPAPAARGCRRSIGLMTRRRTMPASGGHHGCRTCHRHSRPRSGLAKHPAPTDQS